ncbi:hypothetical protein [Granulicella sp. dw_53]|uniref:hypothetical protein n=1 Tax=Granulicella sp. dw_53 TaxID=2719792 RepID=UPI001BD68132|nr:hypothetical protein [Granulicella sp. dw_53]
MATTVLRPINRRYDRIFFSLMTILILATVLIGFARTYYLAGLVRAPLPNALIHIHGAIFSSWLILLTVQTGLISARRLDLHKRLGLYGFGLACLMVILGTLAARDSLRRGFAVPGLDSATFFIVPITDMIVFAVLIYLAYRARFDSAAHKRLILIATVAILDAAIARWPFAFIVRSHWGADMVCYAFLVLLAAYDLFTLRRIHRITLWASAFVIVVQQFRIPLGMTKAWHSVANLALGKF